ncbi:MAG: hypothetical protein WCO13_09960 [Bacteroidota bacterium]
MRLKAILFLSFTLIFFQTNFAQEQKKAPTLSQLDSILKTNCNLMKQINISDLDMLMVNDCKLNEIEACLEMLKFENIAAQIDFKKKEEIAIYEYFTETTTQTAQLRVVLNQYISNIDFWFYKKAMEYLAKEDSANASEKIEKSLLVNPFYLPALYQKAMMYLKNSQTASASKVAEFVSVNLYPNGNDWMLVKAMNEQINKQYKTRGEKMLKAEYCNESLEIFMQADSFCNYFKSSDCEYFKNGILLSKYGLYRSYLRVADQAMDEHKYSIAETFVLKAKEYASTNRAAIQTDAEADKFLKRILTKYIELELYYRRTADNPQSSYYAEKSNNICSILKDKECEMLLLKKEVKIPETKPQIDSTIAIATLPIPLAHNKHKIKSSINTKHPKLKKHFKIKKTKTVKEKPKEIETQTPVLVVQQKTKTKSRDYNIYFSLIELGDELSNSTKYEEALIKYQAAKEIEKAALSKPNFVLDSIINATSYHIINSQLQIAGFLIWANELSQADTVYLFCISLQQKYHLENDAATKVSLDLFKYKIAQKACQNIQDEIDLLNNKTQNYIAIKDFEKAQRLLNEANVLIKNHTECVLNSDKTYQLLKTTKPVSDYFQLKQMAKTAFEMRDCKSFTENYYHADQVYLQFKLDTLGIPNNNTLDYLNYQSNEEFILFVANYFLEFYDFNYCLDALKLLKNKGYQAGKVKEIQLKLAQMQIKVDKLNALFDANTYIMKYTGDDKWFKVFNTEYKRN